MLCLVLHVVGAEDLYRAISERTSGQVILGLKIRLALASLKKSAIPCIVDWMV